MRCAAGPAAQKVDAELRRDAGDHHQPRPSQNAAGGTPRSTSSAGSPVWSSTAVSPPVSAPSAAGRRPGTTSAGSFGAGTGARPPCGQRQADQDRAAPGQAEAHPQAEGWSGAMIPQPAAIALASLMAAGLVVVGGGRTAAG